MSRTLFCGLALSLLGFCVVTAAVFGTERTAPVTRSTTIESPRGALPAGAAVVREPAALHEALSPRTYLLASAAKAHRRVWQDRPERADHVLVPACEASVQLMMPSEAPQAPVSSGGPVR